MQNVYIHLQSVRCDVVEAVLENSLGLHCLSVKTSMYYKEVLRKKRNWWPTTSEEDSDASENIYLKKTSSSKTSSTPSMTPSSHYSTPIITAQDQPTTLPTGLPRTCGKKKKQEEKGIDGRPVKTAPQPGKIDTSEIIYFKKTSSSKTSSTPFMTPHYSHYPSVIIQSPTRSTPITCYIVPINHTTPVNPPQIIPKPPPVDDGSRV